MTKSFKHIVFLCLGLGILSCHKLEIDNPNGGQNPNFQTAITTAGTIYCGEFARISSMFTQQLKGNDIHYQPIYDLYKLSDSRLKGDYDDAYRHGIALAIDRALEYDEKANRYPPSEIDQIAELKQKADEGRLLAACIYSIIIEYFYNPELYQGRNISPVALTYTHIFDLLDEISTPEYIDEVKLLKTRMLINQEEYSLANTMINSIEHLDQIDYSIQYAGTSTNTNDWVRCVGTRGGYLSADSANIVNLHMQNDPRLPFYYTTDESFNFPMSRNLINIPLIGTLEGYFLQAELKVRMNDLSSAQIAYKKGIEQSMFLTGVSNFDTYISINGYLSTLQETALKQVLTQKYIALFGHPLVFVDYKRTKLPTITEKTSPFPDKWTYFYQ